MLELVQISEGFAYHRIECHYRVCSWVHVPGQTNCEHDDQSVWIYDDVTGTILETNHLTVGSRVCC